MGRKKKTEIEHVTDAGENLVTEALDYAELCREFIGDYFRKYHEGEKDVIINFARISKEPRNVFFNALRRCRSSVGEFPGLRVPFDVGGYSNYKYDQNRAYLLAEIFIDLCQSTDHSPSLRGFWHFSGIDINTLKLWKANGTEAGSRIYDMIVDDGKESTISKLDDSKMPVAHIEELNRNMADGTYAKSSENTVKTIEQIVAEMGIVMIEDKGGAS